MSEYNVSVSGGVQELNVPLHGHLGVEIRQYPVVPNPEGEATEEIFKMGINDVIYEIEDAEAREILQTKVDKVEGKGLSENDFTDTLKDKLDSIEAEANKTVVDNSVTATSTNPVESKAIYNMLNNLLPEVTEIGNPIEISNAIGLNAKSLKVALLPIQDLNGYDNAWVGGAGKNKFDKTAKLSVKGYLANRYLTSNGGLQTPLTGEWYVSEYIPVKASTLYTLSGTETSDSNSPSVCLYNSSKEYITGYPYANNPTKTFVTTSDTAYIRLSVGGLSTTENNIQFEEGGTPTTYAPYENICPISGRTQTEIEVNSEDTIISFGQTVYGGEVDVVNGGTREDFAFHELNGTENWEYYSVTQGNMFRLAVDDKSSAVELIALSPYCNSYKPISQGSRANGTVSGGLGTSALDFIDNRFSNLTQWKQYLSSNKVQIVYKKTTPTEISTTSNVISLNKGENTLAAEGEMELKYSKVLQ